MSKYTYLVYCIGAFVNSCSIICRTLERCLKESRCLDLESLCIISEEKVFEKFNLLNWSKIGTYHVRCGQLGWTCMWSATREAWRTPVAWPALRHSPTSGGLMSRWRLLHLLNNSLNCLLSGWTTTWIFLFSGRPGNRAPNSWARPSSSGSSPPPCHNHFCNVSGLLSLSKCTSKFLKW